MAHIVPFAAQGISLVFGLHWEAVIGGNGKAQAMRACRKADASHMVFAGGAMAAVGYGSPGKPAHRNLVMHAAAQCFAAMHPAGSVLLIMPLEGVGIWVVACHEGVVVSRTDCFFASSQQMLPMVDDLRQLYRQLQIIDALTEPGVFTLEALAGAAQRTSLLVRTGCLYQTLSSHWRRLLPMVLIPVTWLMLAPDDGASDAAPAPIPVDAHQQWLDATRHLLAMRQAGDVSGRALLRSLYDIPLQIKGWTLSHVVCESRANQWGCQAVYLRDPGGSDNAAFFDNAPRDWQLQVQGLDQIRARWQVMHASVPLRLDILEDRTTTDRLLLSALQRITPAVERIVVGQSEPLTPVMTQSGDGVVIPSRPSTIPALSKRSLQVSGPLRSAALLLTHAQAMTWNRAEIVYRAQAGQGLKQSRLNFVLKGEIHETM